MKKLKVQSLTGGAGMLPLFDDIQLQQVIGGGANL